VNIALFSEYTLHFQCLLYISVTFSRESVIIFSFLELDPSYFVTTFNSFQFIEN